MLITFRFGYVLISLFESDKIETEGQILYLEPNGVIVDKAITFDYEILGNSTDQIELEKLLKVINNAGTDDDLKAIYLNVDGLSAYYALH